MRLDSVRELKATLTQSVVRRIPTLRLPAPARRVTDVESVSPTVALGVAPAPGRRGGFQLAVRVQHRAVEEYVDAIRRASRREADVRYVGPVVKRQRPPERRRQRPVRIGVSVGHHAITAGTLGCFARRGRSGLLQVLSNNHVLADENRAALGDPILQPGRADGGRAPRDVIASLATFVRLRSTSANEVDCALAVLHEGVPADPTALGEGGRLSGVVEEVTGEDEIVEKIGRTTGHTTGRVTAFELDNVIVGYDAGPLRFDNQIEIEGTADAAFSAGGDSGSLVFTSGAHRALGLVFAGSDQGGTNGQGLTYCNPMTTVLRRLRASLVL